jgi:hypothetical protein
VVSGTTRSILESGIDTACGHIFDVPDVLDRFTNREASDEELVEKNRPRNVAVKGQCFWGRKAN